MSQVVQTATHQEEFQQICSWKGLKGRKTPKGQYSTTVKRCTRNVLPLEYDQSTRVIIEKLDLAQ